MSSLDVGVKCELSVDELALNLAGYVSTLEFILIQSHQTVSTLNQYPRLNDELNQCGKNRYLNVDGLVLKR